MLMIIKIFIFNSRKYDYLTSLLVEGLYKINNVELKFSNLGSYALEKDVLKSSDIYRYCYELADIVVLGSNHYVDYETFSTLTECKAKKVYLDGWDTGQIGLNLKKFRVFDYIFKTNLYQKDDSLANLYRIIFNKKKYSLWSKFYAHTLIPFPYFHGMQNHMRIRDLIRNIATLFYPKHIYPMPFGIEDRVINNFNEKPEYFISCMMLSARVPERNKLISYLEGKKKDFKKIFIGIIAFDDESWEIMERLGASDPFIDRDNRGYATQNKKYYDQLNNSHICISVPGGGFETFRYWEILASGALLISKRISLQAHNSLTDGVHFLGFDTIDELDDVLNFALKNPGEIMKIRRAGYEFSLKHHRSYNRAKYFLSKTMDI